MKKTLALILAIVMALGCMSITAFAAENSKSAEITAEITAADFGYTMVIPTSTTLTEAKHENVLLGTTAAADGDGIVSIKDIKHPTDKVNVYYTVDLTNGNLTDGTNTIAATYKYKQGGDFTAIDGTTKVTVYENATVKNSLVNVTADDTQWKAAPAGSYTATVVFNFAKENVITYMDWDSANKKLVEKSTSDYIEVTNATTTLDAGKFYVVNGEVSTAGLVVNGTSESPTWLILTDGAQLTVTGADKKAGIEVTSNYEGAKALVITGQSGGTGTLIATGGKGDSSNQGGAGIGGYSTVNAGTVTINGGMVTAIGGEGGKGGGAGIGGGGGSKCGTVIINGGTVNATGAKKDDNGGAGIGGGTKHDGGDITINGGEVFATGGDGSAGIGGSYNYKAGTVTINGGSVTANGGSDGAGIGGGEEGNGGTVTINGGTVTANGGSAGAGIGGGRNGKGGTVTINGGSVTANGGSNSAGIGGGRNGKGGTVTINGGSVTANGSGSEAIGKGSGATDSGTVFFGSGSFTVKAGSTDPGTDTTADAYKADHSARYVHVEEVK